MVVNFALDRYDENANAPAYVADRPFAEVAEYVGSGHRDGIHAERRYGWSRCGGRVHDHNIHADAIEIVLYAGKRIIQLVAHVSTKELKPTSKRKSS